MNEKRGKVFVGMSGGVDSSVSAALLQKDGYEVRGVFIKVWQPDFLPCTWREERRDAMRAAAHLGIPFLTLDLEKEYKEGVVDYMIAEYSAGQTPNPDVMCNKHVKFGAFLNFAINNGADYIATGHYATNQSTPRSHLGTPLQGETLDLENVLRAGLDKEKDQSYFLWTLTQGQLGHILFPVGAFQKSEVRKLAAQFGLPNADKKDSQGLCFMGPVDMRDFLKHYIPSVGGAVLDRNGIPIGTHDGSIFYTIGQRHGFVTDKKIVNSGALYVVSKNMKENTITVHSRDLDLEKTVELSKFSVGSINLIGGVKNDGMTIKCAVRIRHGGELHSGELILSTDHDGEFHFANNISISVAPGQSSVFYDGDTCLGGGIVA